MARVQNLDLYKVLDVEEGVDSARIQSSYRLRARNCHPDRHPGKESTFHTLKDALDVLTDPEYKGKYDRILASRKALEKRNSQIDTRRRHLKTDLEKREKASQSSVPDERENTIQRLRREGDLLVEKSEEDIIIGLRNLVITTPKEKTIIKVKWSTQMATYSIESLGKIFFKYGNILNVVMGTKKNTALVEFENIQAAQMAYNIEKGHRDHLSWVGFDYDPLLKPMFEMKALFKDTSSSEVFPRYMFKVVSGDIGTYKFLPKKDIVQYIHQMETMVFSKMDKSN